MAAVIDLDGVEMGHVDGYNPGRLTRRMSKKACIGGQVNYQVFSMVPEDETVTLSVRETVTKLKALIQKAKQKGQVYALTDEWGSIMSVLIRAIEYPPIRGTNVYIDFQLVLEITDITKLFGENW